MAKILLVEDSKAQAMAATEFLEGLGHEVVWAADGTGGIKQATTSAFDLVLLDLVLPDMHGNQVCQWLKKNPATLSVPVIMLTAQDTMEDRVSGLDAGAEDFLLKPYSEPELRARISAVLRTKALRDELEEKNQQLKELLMQVQVLAVTDPLTGLYNRRHFTTVLEQEFDRLKRYRRPMALLMVDIDHFKSINDTYGHKTGDEVLVNVAHVLTGNLRQVDVIARWGGEEFIVLLPESTRPKAEEAAKRLLEGVASHRFVSLDGRKVTVSIGVNYAPDSDVETPDRLIDTADKALYRAKESGRNRVEVYVNGQEART